MMIVDKHFVYNISDSKTGEMLYIGETGNIFNRISCHPQLTTGMNISFIQVSSREDRKKIELALIYHFKPSKNRRIPTTHYLLPDWFGSPDSCDWRSLDSYSFTEWLRGDLK